MDIENLEDADIHEEFNNNFPGFGSKGNMVIPIVKVSDNQEEKEYQNPL